MEWISFALLDHLPRGEFKKLLKNYEYSPGTLTQLKIRLNITNIPLAPLLAITIENKIQNYYSNTNLLYASNGFCLAIN